MRSLRWLLAALFVAAAGLLLLGPADLRGQQILQYGFETRGPVWRAGGSDAAHKVLAHELTTDTAHNGQRSEHLRLQIERGSYIHYVYDLPRAPITRELNVSLWLKSNRPGVQLLCRIVLPKERDPNNLGQNLTALVRCEPYQNTRWKLINLADPPKRLREQNQLLNHQLGREVDVSDAYIDQLVLNLCDGPGVVDVWIDDLEVGPVLDTRPANSEPVARTLPGASPANRRAAEVQVTGNHLKVGGRKFLLRGVRHTGTPLRTLRDAGFNTVWLDESTPGALIDEAVNLGFWIVPSIQPPQEAVSHDNRPAGQLTASEHFSRQVGRFLDQDSVLAWDLGSNLTAEQFARTSRLAQAFRAADPQRPVLADVWDGYRGYSRTFDQLLLGTHRWPLYTSLELTAYKDWLQSRRNLVYGSYGWTWIQTHLPEWYTRLVYGSDTPESFKEPVGPQPEQIRLLTYCALAAGYRGLAFWSDRYLADSHQGRDRLLAMALLNQELRLLEPILVQATQDPDLLPTSRGEVQAAVIRTPKAVLVLPVWMGPGSQYVPGQAALVDLKVTVPVPNTCTAWEVSPGFIRSHRIERVLGGSQVKLHNFSLTSALVFTSDLGPNGVVVQLQEQQRRMGRLAAQWLCQQAEEERKKVERVHAAIEGLGQAQPDAQPLLRKAREALARAVGHRRNGEHSDAYEDAEVALRCLRVLMRSHWEKAVRDLDSPVASPYALSYFTLPKHLELLAELKRMHVVPAELPGGDFERDPDEVQPGWVVQEVPSLDPVETTLRRVDSGPHRGKQCLMMQVSPKDKDPRRTPAVIERTFVAIQSPAVRLKPGSLARVSVWVRSPGVGGSTDGALIYDSVGGEPLAVRITHQPKWKRYCLFRRVPASGTISVTLAMSGMGSVFFDDVRIEALEPGAAPAGNEVMPARPPAASDPLLQASTR